MILAAGAQAPDFDLADQHGASTTLTGLLRIGPVALVFFPLAFSRGCQGELCALQERLDVFADADVRVVAVSVDSKYALKAWGAEQAYDFPLLSDFWPHGDVARAYGAFLEDRGYATRATFVIDPDRSVRASFAVGPGEARTLDQYRAAIRA